MKHWREYWDAFSQWMVDATSFAGARLGPIWRRIMSGPVDRQNEHVTQKDLSEAGWRYVGWLVAASLFLWSTLSSDIEKVRSVSIASLQNDTRKFDRELGQIDQRMSGVQDRIAKIEVSLERMSDDTRDAAMRLRVIEQQLADISMRVGAGPVGGPTKRPR